jgi:uncharacterized FAD-dependent dehydrogenase
MGGGNFVVPVQTVPDFLENKLSGKIMGNYHNTICMLLSGSL